MNKRKRKYTYMGYLVRGVAGVFEAVQLHI